MLAEHIKELVRQEGDGEAEGSRLLIRKLGDEMDRKGDGQRKDISLFLVFSVSFCIGVSFSLDFRVKQITDLKNEQAHIRGQEKYAKNDAGQRDRSPDRVQQQQEREQQIRGAQREQQEQPAPRSVLVTGEHINGMMLTEGKNTPCPIE